MIMSKELRVIEALLFATADPITPEIIQSKLVALGQEEASDIPALMNELKKIYNGHGIELHHIGGGWMFRTAPDLYESLALPNKALRKLSRAGLETLAVIAYHQPLTRGEIEEIRGVSLHKNILDILLETGWIVPAGRRESPGRPILWGTSSQFLVEFGLSRISDLPNLEELRRNGLLDQRPNLTILSMEENSLSL